MSRMKPWTTRLLFAAILLAIAPPAFAHHPMGGVTPVTFTQGFLSGLAHPVLGLDHLAVVIAVGCLAAAHRAGIGLVGGFVLAMIVGVAVHVRGMNVAAIEILLASAVIVLGIAIQFRDSIGAAAMIALFTVAGLLSGYALGESITGAQPAPLSAYFVGLALVQLALAVAVMWFARRFAMRPYAGVAMNVRLIGAAVMGIGFSALVTQAVWGA
jgi:urease accessory protein